MKDAISQETSQNEISLRRVCQYVRVCPPAECLEALRSTAFVSCLLPEVGLAVGSIPLPMLEVLEYDASGPAQFLWAGLQPAVHAVLEAAGHSVLIDGPVPAPLPPPDLGVLRQLGLNDLQVLELVRGYDRALLCYDGRARVDPAYLVAQIALAWPDRKLVVALKRVDDVRTVCNRLRKILPDITALSGDDHPAAFGRVVVATTSYCYHPALAPRERDIFIAFNALEFAGQQNWDVAKYFVNARLYGLLDVDDRPAPTVRDRLVALFGFREVFVPQHGCRVRPMVRIEAQSGGAVRGLNSADRYQSNA